MSKTVAGETRRVAFRADASTRMGLGHLKRCASLSEALNAVGFTTQLVTRNLGSRLPVGVGNKFDMVCILPPLAEEVTPDPNIPHSQWAEVDQATDADQFLGALEIAPEWVVIDHYAFDRQWIEAVRAATDARQLAIDDLGDRPLPVDILVDHNLAADHVAKHWRSLRVGTKLLAGPKYALIDQVYATAPRYRFSETVRSIGIFMGGVDAGGLSLPIAQALRDTGFTGGIVIATTSANPLIAALHEAAPGLGIDIALDRPDLADFFAAHDLQIGASGGATWERCCLGAPTLAVTVAANQREVLDPLANLGVVAILSGDAPNPGEIAIAARRLIDDPLKRAELSVRTRRLVDGRGAARVAEELLSL